MSCDTSNNILDFSINNDIINWSQRMTIQSDRYTYRITWSEEDKEYVGLCTEFPSLSWLAESPESALKGISLNRLVSAKLSRQ